MAKKSINTHDLFKELSDSLRARADTVGVRNYVPMEVQKKFHETETQGRLYSGGNRAGKTVAGVVEDVKWLTGTHEVHSVKYPPPVRGRVCGVDFDRGVDLVLLPEFRKWIPPEFLIEGKWEKSYHKGTRLLTLTNGSTCEFMSYDQDIDKFAGTSRHFCVDEKTQILTRRGWQSYDTVLFSDEIYTINTETEEGEWKPITSVYVADVNEDLIHIKSRDLDALVTKDHRWFVSNKKTKKSYMTETLELKTTEQFIVSGNPERTQEDFPVSDNVISLVGWVLTDGSISNGNMSIAQSSSNNLHKCTIIENLLSEVKYYEYPYENGEGLIRHYQITGELRKEILDIVTEHKLFPYVWASHLSVRQRNLLLDAIMLGDGFQWESGKKAITQHHLQRREGFATLMSWCGHSVFIGENAALGKTKFSERFDYSRVSVASCEKKQVSYKGKVWCTNNENGTFLAKRNGKVYFTGNCHFDEEPPKAIFTECLARLIDTNGKWWMTMTPLIEFSWTADDLYEPIKDGQLDFITLFEASTHDNVHIQSDAIEKLTFIMAEDEREARTKGSGYSETTLIFPELKNCIVDPIPYKDLQELKGWKFFTSLDHGLRNPTAILFFAVGPDEEIIQFEEYYQTDLLVKENAKAYLELVERTGLEYNYMVGDPSTKNTDPITGTSIRQEYGEHGVWYMLGNNDVRAGILRVKSCFDSGRLKITSNCRNTIREARTYKWKKPISSKVQARSNLLEEPVKRNDHAMDALRYGIMSLPKTEKEEREDMLAKMRDIMPEGFVLPVSHYETARQNTAEGVFDEHLGYIE